MYSKHLAAATYDGHSQYVDGMLKKSNYDHPSAWAMTIAKQYRKQPRSLIQYINKMVDKGIIPKDLKAELEMENYTFKDFVEKLDRVKQDKDMLSRNCTSV